MACSIPIPRCYSHVMLFGPSLYQLALLRFGQMPDLSTEPRSDRERVLENFRMPKLATLGSSAWR